MKLVLIGLFLIAGLSYSEESCFLECQIEVHPLSGVPSAVLRTTVTMIKVDHKSELKRQKKDIMTLPPVYVEPNWTTNFQVGIVTYQVKYDKGNSSNVLVTVSVKEGDVGIYAARDVSVPLKSGVKTFPLLFTNTLDNAKEGEQRGTKGQPSK